MNLGAIQRRLLGLISRAVIGAVNPAAKCQTVDVSMIAGEQKAGIENLEQYGFTSHAQAGAEALLLFPDGERSHALAICVADRRYRMTALAAGEVAVHDDTGQSVVLTRTGIVVNGGGKPITFTNAPKARFNMDIEATGNITDRAGSGGQSMAGMRDTYNQHTHPNNGGSAPNQKMGG